jgi:hypothetical protein
MNLTPARPAGHLRQARQTVRRRAIAVTLVLAAAVSAGCSSATVHRAAGPERRAVSLPLVTSVAAGQTTWAVVPMGATSGPNRFWELFALPAHAARWRLATPPDVATNGAIALSVQGSQSLVAGIHPSLLLHFSPITSTADGGRNWATGAPDPGLASVPDALAITPDATRLMALDRNGGADIATIQPAPGGHGITGPTRWTTLVSAKALAATLPGRTCKLTGLTAVAFASSAMPLLGGDCDQPGVAGIFARLGATWHAAGPSPASLPAALRRQKIQVLRLVRTGTRITALFQFGTGATASLVSARANEPTSAGRTSVAADGTGASDDTWSLSAPLRLAGLTVTSSSFSKSGATAVTLARPGRSGQHAQYISGPGALWHALPALPTGHTLALALPASGDVDVLAADGSTLTVWQLRRGIRWVQTQATKVPIQYGSSS